MRNNRMLLLGIVAAALLLFALPSQAQTETNPWYSTDNLSIAAGANYQWWGVTQGAEQISPKKEWLLGLYNSWTLTEHVDAILNVELGLDSKQVPFKLGLRYVIKAPK